VALAVVAIALWAARPYAVGVYHDDGVYVILAKALATGQGYRFLHLPGAPVAAHYPPGYPLVLALLWRIVPRFPANVMLFLFANAVFTGIAAWYTQRFARRVLGWGAAAAAAAALIATATFPMLLLSGLVLSEPLFAACLLPALIAGERLVAPSNDAPAGGRRALAVGLAAGALALVRTHGLAFELAMVALLALRRRWRDAALCVAGAAIVIVPWSLWVGHRATPLPPGLEGSYGSYLGWFLAGLRATGVHGVVSTVTTNVREVGELLADRWSLADAAVVRHATALLAAAALVAGLWRMARRAPVTAAFVAIYLLVMLAWPFTPWRFLYAVWPLIVLCMGAAVAWGARLPARAARSAVVAATAVLLLGMARAEVRSDAARSWRSGAANATAAIGPLVRWVSSNTSPSDVVAVDGEQLVYLFTGRTAVPIVPFTAAEYVMPRTTAMNAASIAQLLRAVPVNYLVTIAPPLRDAARLVAQRDTTAGAPRLRALGAVGAGEAFRVQNR